MDTTELWQTMAGIRYKSKAGYTMYDVRPKYSEIQKRHKTAVLHLTPVHWDGGVPKKGHYKSLCGVQQIKGYSLPWHHKHMPVCKTCERLAQHPIDRVG